MVSLAKNSIGYSNKIKFGGKNNEKYSKRLLSLLIVFTILTLTPFQALAQGVFCK